MTGWMSARRCVVAVGSACLVALAVPAAAQDDAFKRGADLLRSNDGDARAAAELMREAIRQDPKESRRTVGRNVIGLGGIPYLPHYFLGEALMRAGDCAGAVGAWDVSLQQKVVYGEYQDRLRKWSAECEAKGILLDRQFAQQYATSLQAVTAAGDYLGRVRQRIDDSTWQAHPEMVPQYNEANAQYLAARKALETARASRQQRDFAESQAAALRTNNALTRLEAALAAALDAAELFRRRANDIEQAIAAAARQFEALATGLSPALSKDRQSAGDSIERARERLAAGRKTQNAASLDEATAHASNATSALGRIRDQLQRLEIEQTKRRFDQVVSSASQAFQSFDEAIARLDELTERRGDRVAPDFLTEREALRQRLAGAKRRFEAARAAGNADAVRKAAAGLEAERSRLNALLVDFGPLTLRDRGVPAIIEDGLRLFLEGEHEKVVELLSPEAIDPSLPLAAHAHLVRAGSLYALFVRSGGTNQALLTSARQEAERTRMAEPALSPDPRVFSRRFIAFFQTATEPVR